MLNRFLHNAPLFNQAVAAASSVDSGATRSPFGHIVVAIPDGDLVLIYQQGTNGLCYRVSTNGGTVWGAEQVIDAKITVYASAIVNPTTKDIHVVYSAHADPGSGADAAIYYRPLIWDSGANAWNVGGEQTLAGGGGIYDPAVAGRRNASVSVGDDGFPVITYLRNEYGVVSWAMLVAQETWAFTDFDVDLDIGVTADEDSRGAAVQSDNRDIYFVSRTGSWYSLASATIANPMVGTGVDMTVLFSWLGTESEMVAVARNDDGDRLGIVYLAGDGAPHFRLYNIDTYALISDTAMDTSSADSVSITWDGAVFWLAWVADDNVRVSNSAAPATVVQTFSNPGPDEDWSWLNSPVSCVYSANVIFVWCATSSSIYTGVFSLTRPITVAETGAGSDVAQIEVSEDELGTGADGAVVYEPIDVPDTGSGSDTPTVGPWVEDTGTGTDVGGKGVTIDETGTGTDAVQIAMSVAEIGTGADGATYYQTVPAADTGTSTTGQSVEIAVADAGVGTDAVLRLDVPVAEMGTGADSVVIELAGAAESGTGADALSIGIDIDDTGLGTDAPSATKLGTAEMGTGTDAVQIAMTGAAEMGTGTDRVGSGNAIFVNVSDTGTGVDTPSVAWIPTAVVVRLLQNSGRVRLKTES